MTDHQGNTVDLFGLYVAALRRVYEATCAHDQAWAAYYVKRGINTPDSVPETQETVALLRTVAGSRAALDLAKVAVERAEKSMADEVERYAAARFAEGDGNN